MAGLLRFLLFVAFKLLKESYIAWAVCAIAGAGWLGLGSGRGAHLFLDEVHAVRVRQPARTGQ